jgi:hypothetical protein
MNEIINKLSRLLSNSCHLAHRNRQARLLAFISIIHLRFAIVFFKSEHSLFELGLSLSLIYLLNLKALNRNFSTLVVTTLAST